MQRNSLQDAQKTAPGPALSRTVALVGLMGAGKSALGRRLAAAVGADFCDADDEIEQAAGMSISEIFSIRGEAEFREGEKKVIARLLERPPFILATGGGAFMNAETRALLKRRTLTIWLKADLDLLVERTSRRDIRPLLRDNDPKEVLRKLIDQRYPVYAQATAICPAVDQTHEESVERLVAILRAEGALK